jgi:hypothetical protein
VGFDGGTSWQATGASFVYDRWKRLPDVPQDLVRGSSAMRVQSTVSCEQVSDSE